MMREVDKERAREAMSGNNSRLAAAYSDLQRIHEQLDSTMDWIKGDLENLKRELGESWRPGEKYANGVVIKKPSEVSPGLKNVAFQLPALVAELNATRRLICMLERMEDEASTDPLVKEARAEAERFRAAFEVHVPLGERTKFPWEESHERPNSCEFCGSNAPGDIETCARMDCPVWNPR